MQVKVQLSNEYHSNQTFYSRTRDFVDCDPIDIIGKGYIRSYDTEDTTEAVALNTFPKRLARSYPLTLSESILEEHVAACAQEISIEGFEFPDILSDVTGFDSSAGTFLAEQLREHFKNGFHGVLIESVDQTSPTKAGAQDNGERSYQTLFPAESIIQCKYFMTGKRRGQVKDVVLLVESSYRTNEKKEVIEVANARRYYFEDDLQVNFEYQELSIDAEKLKGASKEISFDVVRGPEPGDLKIIPFVAFGCGPKDSAIRKTIPLDIGVLNTTSTLRNTNYHQAFQRVLVFGVRDPVQAKTIGEARMGIFPEAEGHADAIPPGDAAALEREINFLLHWARRIGMRQFRQLTDDLTKQVSSAESKAKDLKALESWYNKTLDMFERKLKQVYWVMNFYETSKDSADIQVKISRDFGLDDSEAQLMSQQVVWSWSQEFGDEGFQLRREILLNHLDDIEMTPEDRKELAEKLRTAIRKNPLLPDRQNPLATLINDAPKTDTGAGPGL